jgi:hypothetical protein
MQYLLVATAWKLASAGWTAAIGLVAVLAFRWAEHSTFLVLRVVDEQTAVSVAGAMGRLSGWPIFMVGAAYGLYRWCRAFP